MDTLVQSNKQFVPFVNQLQELLDGFKINQVCQLLEEYLSEPAETQPHGFE
jgi:hypothetical protein